MEGTDTSGTLNTTASEVNQLEGVVSQSGPGGVVNADSPKVNPDSINEYSDIDGKKDAVAASSSEDAKDTDLSDGGEEKKAVSNKTPFHLDPAWQRIIKEREDARIEAAKWRAMAATQTAQPQVSSQEKALRTAVEKPYIDITQLDEEQLTDWQRIDPKGYAANLYMQVREEAQEAALKNLESKNAERLKAAQKAALQKKVGETYKAFAKQNPDFADKWNAKELHKFMRENPGHNPISAYLSITNEAKIKEAADKAAKEAEAKAQANLKAKQNARVLSGAGGVAPRMTPGGDAELQNTKESGGLVSVLAGKLARLRAGG